MSLQLHDDYWMRQIVFINSGNAAHVALPLSETGALFGRNNIGKTSAVSALKLFILPETNFKSCESKFAFQSNGQFHKADESFTYYFPSERSFIICEGENPKGRFCMILHRSREEWGYARIVVPVAYESIKHLFWHFDEQSNSGLGRNLKEIDLQTVKRGLKEFNPRYLTNSREIREAIYVRPGPLEDLSWYCLIPLTQKGEIREVEALRALLNLAFDIKGGADTTLPKAVACIIESENAGKDGSLAVDIGAITQEYTVLKGEGDALVRVRQHQETWGKLKNSFQKYVPLRQTFRTQHDQLAAEAMGAKEQIGSLIDELGQTQGSQQDVLSQLNNALSQANGHLIALKKRQEDKGREMQALQADLRKIDEAWQLYKPIVGIEDVQDVVQYLKEQIPEIEAEITAYEDDAEAQKQLAELNEKRKKIDREIEETKATLEGAQEHTLGGLHPHGRSVLYSINPEFGNIRCTISDADKQRIDGFTDLFEFEDGQMRFLDQRINIHAVPFDPELVRRSLSDELVRKRDERHQIVERLRRISDRKARPDKLAETRKDLEKAGALISLIPGHDYMLQQRERLADEIDRLDTTEIPEAMAVVEQTSSDVDAAKAKASAIQRQLENSRLQLKDIGGHADKLAIAVTDVREGFSDRAFDRIADDLESPESCDLHTLGERVIEFGALAKTLKSLKSEIARTLHVLISNDILPERRMLLYDAEASFDDVHKQYEDIRAIFENYDDNLKKYREDIEHHNNETGVRSAAVTAIADAIRSFENTVNRELSACKISNLSEVRLVIELDNRFESLRKDLARTVFSGDQLINDSVYQRLNAFCDEFFSGNATYGRRVQLDKVITKIRYRYVINGVEKTAQQSNGTTGMISSVLLALLLKRMIPRSSILHFPIVFDEVLSLDSQNIRTIKRVVEENNFVLFVACPENAGNVADVIPRWYDLSLHVLTEGDMIEGCSVLYCDLVESLTNVKIEDVAEVVQ